MAMAPVLPLLNGTLTFPMDDGPAAAAAAASASEEQESALGEQGEQDPLGLQVCRQPRRQQIPRAPRRCFPSSFTRGADSPGTNELVPVSSCSYRTGDEETATCSRIFQSTTVVELRRDCVETGSLRSPTNSTNVSEDGDSSVSCASWSSGQLVWAKFSRSPWWPAQIVDERLKTRNSRQDPKTDVLVRFFGNYNYGWVDAGRCLSKFDMNFHERSQVATKAFQKGLKEAIDYRDYRKLPLKWRHAPSSKQQEECQTPGKESSEDTGSEAHESERLTSARRRKPKVLYEDEERLHQKPKRNLRRKRIMRELGLAAPYGSPFTLGSNL